MPYVSMYLFYFYTESNSIAKFISKLKISKLLFLYLFLRFVSKGIYSFSYLKYS